MCVCVCVCVCVIGFYLRARRRRRRRQLAARACLPRRTRLAHTRRRTCPSCCRASNRPAAAFGVWEPSLSRSRSLAWRTKQRARAPFFFFARWRTPMAARRGATLASRGLSRHASHDLVPCHGMLIAALRGKGGIALAKHALKPASSSGGEAARTRRPHSSNRHLNVVIAAARALLSVLELLGAGFLRMRLGRECFP